jgi:hypothetical protein
LRGRKQFVVIHANHQDQQLSHADTHAIDLYLRQVVRNCVVELKASAEEAINYVSG